MTNAVAEKKTDPAYSLAKRMETSVGTALPAHITKQQFSRALLTSLRKTPGLLRCDERSVATAVVTAAQLGLMIDVNGACWLIPFGKECQLVIGYQGLVDLCYRSGLVESISADVVCRNDEFIYRQGLDQRLDHTPVLDGDRGEPYAVYAIARIKGSTTPVYVVLNRDEVLAVRNASPAAKSKQSPWNGPFSSEMWKKTAIRRLCKLLPKSVELVKALDFEAKQDERWAEAAVVDDPFAQGRRSLPAKASAPVPEDGWESADDHNHQVPAPADDVPASSPAADAPPASSTTSFLGAGDQKRRDTAYAALSAHFDTAPDVVDDLLRDAGLPPLMDIDRKTCDLGLIEKLTAATKLLAARKDRHADQS